MGLLDTSLFYLVVVFACSLPCIDRLLAHFTKAFLFCVLQYLFLKEHLGAPCSGWSQWPAGFVLGGIGEALQRTAAPTPAWKLSLSSPHRRPGDHVCVLLSSCLQLRQKRDGKCQGKQFPPPLQRRVPQSLLYRPCFLLNLECFLRMALFEICLSWREIFCPYVPVQ